MNKTKRRRVRSKDYNNYLFIKNKKMLDQIIKSILAIAIGFVLYWALSMIVTALGVAVGFAYVSVALAIIAGLLIIAVCVFIARLFGVSI